MKNPKFLMKRNISKDAKPDFSAIKAGELAINVYDKDIFVLASGDVKHVNNAVNLPIEDTATLLVNNLEEAILRVKNNCDALNPPQVLTPSSGSHRISLRPSLSGSPFQPIFNTVFTNRQFQVDYENGDWDDPILDVIRPTYSYRVLSDLPDGDLKVRIRDYDDQGNISDWSEVSYFTTSYNVVPSPTITVEGAPTLVSRNPTISISSFASGDIENYHVSTDWRVSQGETILYDYQDDETRLTSITLDVIDLQPDTEYLVEVRQNGAGTGYTPWSSQVFKTRASWVEVPIITFPNTGRNNYNGVISSHSPLEQVDSAEWQVALDSNFENLIISNTKVGNFTSLDPELDLNIYEDKSIYVRVRYERSGLVSTWSAVTQYRTPTIRITKPIPTLSDNLNYVTVTPTLLSSTFTITEDAKPHTKTHWQILSGSTILWEEETDSQLTSIDLPYGILLPYSYYFLKVKYSSGELESEWGVCGFRTEANFVDADFSEVTTSGSTGLVSVVGLIDQGYEHVQWESSFQSNFRHIEDRVENTSFTSFTPTFDSVSDENRKMYVRFRYKLNLFYTRWHTYNFVIDPIIATTPAISLEGYPNNPILETPLISVTALELSNPGATSKFIGTAWRVLDAEGQIIWSESKADTPAPFNLPAGILKPNKDYTIQARHRCGNYGYSAWANIPFTTKGTFLGSPVLTMEIDRSSMIVDLTHEAGKDVFTYDQVEWEVSPNPNFSGRVNYYIGEENFVNWYSAIENAGLSPDTEVFIRVRYKKDGVWYPFSTISITLPHVLTPQILGNLPLISTSPFTLSEGQ